MYEEYGWLKRNIIKGISVFKVAFSSVDWVREVNNIFLSLRIRGKDRIVLLFNFISYKSLLDRCDKKEVEYLFDEGVFQLIWAVYLRTDYTVSEEIVCRIINHYHQPDKLLIIDADTETIMERLRNRGRTTRILESDDLSQEIKKMKSVLNRIIYISKQIGILNKSQVTLYDNKNA